MARGKSGRRQVRKDCVALMLGVTRGACDYDRSTRRPRLPPALRRRLRTSCSIFFPHSRPSSPRSRLVVAALQHHTGKVPLHFSFGHHWPQRERQIVQTQPFVGPPASRTRLAQCGPGAFGLQKERADVRSGNSEGPERHGVAQNLQCSSASRALLNSPSWPIAAIDATRSA